MKSPRDPGQGQFLECDLNHRLATFEPSFGR
jgi:hypothetical protein